MSVLRDSDKEKVKSFGVPTILNLHIKFHPRPFRTNPPLHLLVYLTQTSPRRQNPRLDAHDLTAVDQLTRWKRAAHGDRRHVEPHAAHLCATGAPATLEYGGG